MSASQHPARPSSSEPARPRQPLYRREPWLAILLLGLIIMAVTIALPEDTRRYGIYAGLVVGAVGVVALLMHRPDPAEEARWREYRHIDD